MTSAILAEFKYKIISYINIQDVFSGQNGLFQKKSTPPRRMACWKFSREGGGGRGLWKSRWEGGLDLKLLFGGHFKKCNLSFQIFDFTEETFSESKKVVVFQSMHFLPFRFSFKDSAKNIIKVIKGENTRKARG